MCYYNGIRVSKEELKFLVDGELQAEEWIRDIQSGFEYQMWPTINAHQGKRSLDIAHWEFIPYWVKDMQEVKEQRKKYTTLNAKGETLLTSKIYKEAALKRRCLVLSSGFYEWRHYKGKTYPYHITVEGKNVFCMAGVYQPWTDKQTGETFDTFAIVTTAANELMTQVHNTKKRMPTILSDEMARIWLKEDLSSKDITEIATSHYPDTLKAQTIVKNFREALNPQEAFEYEELPPLQLA